MTTTVIEVRTSPQLHSGASVDLIMRNVVYALLPICVYAVWLFGISALALIATSTAACVLIEHVFCRLSGKAVFHWRFQCRDHRYPAGAGTASRVPAMDGHRRRVYCGGSGQDAVRRTGLQRFQPRAGGTGVSCRQLFRLPSLLIRRRWRCIALPS